MPRAPRRFPTPWTVEDHNDACFIVKDKSGYALAYGVPRGRTGAPICGQSHGQGRGAAHRGEHRQAAGVGWDDWLGHRSIQHTVRYTGLAPTRFKDFWRD
jgi:hypothetical protein